MGPSQASGGFQSSASQQQVSDFGSPQGDFSSQQQVPSGASSSNYDWLSPGGVSGVSYYNWGWGYPGYYNGWYPNYYGYRYSYPYSYWYYPNYYYNSYDPWWAANVYGPYRTTYYWYSW